MLKNSAIIFVDGRYKVQVDMEVYSLKDLSEFETSQWVSELLPKNSRIGIDLKLHSFT
ncbi:hypothetical protein ACPUVO_12870 [Pseudocolwellia sp. HL-MZ19]|uniref:hypothetical protein n=1 Tax=unclassified Pseudocolwellia TaxID=2848178 RepID=UPI003CFB79E4